eukprot:comp20053_c0_seq1/m.24643 comp20053_c0_seq1/g.24643  ORF comp20053_c0_seq1/g.24643 comp20053_c0_seq1/m.24643 type:complete len:151 (-) comp20053_c0_seq1:409-861(-)
MELSDSVRSVLKGVAAGTLFSVGWWLWVDAYVFTRTVIDPPELHGTKLDIGWLSGVISTLGLVLVNLVPHELLSGGGMEASEEKARIFFIFSLMTTFGGLTAAVIIMTQNYVDMGVDYLAAAIIVQNVLILLSSLLLRINFGESSTYSMF